MQLVEHRPITNQKHIKSDLKAMFPQAWAGSDEFNMDLYLSETFLDRMSGRCFLDLAFGRDGQETVIKCANWAWPRIEQYVKDIENRYETNVSVHLYPNRAFAIS